MNNNVIYFPQIQSSKEVQFEDSAHVKESNVITVDFVLETRLKRDEDQLNRLRNAFDDARSTWVLEPAELPEMNKRIVK